MNNALPRRLLIAGSAIVVGVLGVALVTKGPVGTGGGPAGGPAGTPATTVQGGQGGQAATGPAMSERLRGEVGAAGIRRHLAEFNRIAAANGGNRAAGTAGYDASAAYVTDQLRAAGYEPRVQEFKVPSFGATAPPVLAVAGGQASPFQEGADYGLLQYSGSGDVSARIVAVDLRIPPAPGGTSGCEEADFGGFPRGAVALLQRGTCPLRQKVENAQQAGATAALVMNEGTIGNRDVVSGTLGRGGIRVPALALSYAAGERLATLAGRGAAVRVMTRTGVATASTVNIIAETRGGSDEHVVMVGAHLDSVYAGPGVNDNGTGSALVLELARVLAAGPPAANRVRFAWWGAEEIGLVGSTEYVRRLSAAQARRIAAYLNFDMLGSANFARLVYDADDLPAGSAVIQRRFDAWFASQGLPTGEVDLSGRSDHGPFAARGIPVGGLFAGADDRPPAGLAAPGSRSGSAADPCYHRACDNLGNVNQRAVDELADGAAHVLAMLAASTAEVDAARRR